MIERISEDEQAHIYSCLLVGNAEFQKIKKSLAKLNREDQKVDDEIALNAVLRKRFNPRAEEKARAKERAKTDPAQTSIDDEIRRSGSSGETGGGHPAGERVEVHIGATVVNVADGEEVPPTDEIIRDNLVACDRFVLLADIRGWTSSDRDAAVKYANAFDMFDPESRGLPVPDCIELVAITNDRMDELVRTGPFTLRGLPIGSEDPTTTVVLIPDAGDDPNDIIDGEYVDEQEAEIRCARVNRTFILNRPMDPDHVTRWIVAGPWSIVSEGEKWYVVLGSEDDLWEEKERVATMEEADIVASHYNMAHWEKLGHNAPPIASDSVQDIKAAAEISDDDGG